MPRKELGEILREADLVSAAQLNQALALQRTFGERLASVLVRQNVLTEKFAVTYLGRQLGVPPVDLSKTEIDLGLLDVVPLELCERHLIFPVRVEGTRLQLAMSDPMDHSLVSELEFKTGVRLAPMIALEAALKNAILEARRALKGGQRKISPNVQRQREVPPAAGGGPPASSAPAAADGPRAEAPPPAIPVSPLEERERAVIETLAGAPVAGPAGPPADRIPEIEEVLTVLLVDDDEHVLSILSDALQARRYRVVTARKGREALAKVRESMPDLVVLDGMLPEVHGFEICRQLKTSERFRHIPVILVSGVHIGWRFAADVKEKYGADDYVEKPLEPGDFVRRVETLLNRAPTQLSPASEAAARQHLKDGVIALKQDRLDQAIDEFGKGLAVDQFNDLLHYYLAVSYEKKDMVFHAIDHYEKAIQINQGFYDAITALANLYQRQEFWRKAVEMWELALAATKDQAVRARIKDHLLSLL
jgi:DNA-binding response OmpR family regulator